MARMNMSHGDYAVHDTTYENVRKAAKQLGKPVAIMADLQTSANRPTAIFASSDMQAIGILRALREAGLSVPEDMALASFDGSAEAEYSWPALTTVEQPAQAMAEAAVTALIGARRGEKPEHRTFPTHLRVRNSCGCQ